MKTDIETLKRERPEAFDEQDVPDITDIDPEMKASLLRNAPPEVRELLGASVLPTSDDDL